MLLKENGSWRDVEECEFIRPAGVIFSEICHFPALSLYAAFPFAFGSSSVG